MLGLQGVRSVRIEGRPTLHVEAVFVEPLPGRSGRQTIDAVVAAARDRLGVEIVSDRIHILPGPDVPKRSGTLLVGVLVAARPRQWVKNLLVFGAPATGGVLTQPTALASAGLAFLAFCLAASGMYLINDVVDMQEDRAHPVKQRRPVASGIVSAKTAVALGVSSALLSLVVALEGGGPPLVGVVGGYLALVLTYTFILREIALLDLAAIAGGFLLRAIAGGVATGVALSEWFLIVAAFGSLYLAAGKRHAEYIELVDDGRRGRASLSDYTESYLRYIQYSSSTIAITAYTLWAFEGAAGGTIWSALSIVPFVLGIFRYGLLIEKGRGTAPEEALLRDGALVLFGAAWVLLVALGVYLT